MGGITQAKSYQSLLRKRARRQAKLVFKAMRRDVVTVGPGQTMPLTSIKRFK